MKRQKLKTGRVFQISRRILKSVVKEDEEINRLVSDPQLFSSIIEEIKIQERAASQTTDKNKTWSYQRLLFQSAAGLVLLFGAATFWLINQNDLSTLKEDTFQVIAVTHAEVRSVPPFPDSGVPSAKLNEQVTTAKSNRKRLPAAAQSARTAKEHSTRSVTIRRGTIKKHFVMPPDDNFYALSITEQTANDLTDSRIIRVTTSRAELSAAGANLTGSDADQKLTAELLVGLDGMPIAYRLVK